MEITVSVLERQWKTVTLPAYRKSMFNYWKIEEESTIELYINMDYFGITYTSFLEKPFQYEECSKEEFDEVYELIKSKITQ